MATTVTTAERNALVKGAYDRYQEMRQENPEAFIALEAWWKVCYLKLGHKALGRIVVGWPLEKLLRDSNER